MQRIYIKSQKPLYHFLLNITISNCYKLSAKSIPSYQLKRSAHKAFREELIKALFNNGKRLTKPTGCTVIIEDKDIYKAPAKEHGQGPMWIFSKQQSCAVCVRASRKASIELKARKPLIELSESTIQKPHGSKDWVRRQRPPRTRFSYSLYKIRLCKIGPCQ